MGKRRSFTEQEIVSKKFTQDEINRGIRKLEKRISDVEGLRNLQHGDQAIENVTSHLVASIREVFGDRSAEFIENRYHRIWDGPLMVGMDNYDYQRGFNAGIPKTISLLKGLVARLEEKRDELEETPDTRLTELLNGFPIQRDIYSACSSLFENGHYAQAVFEAAKTLENMVKGKLGTAESTGCALMFSVFGGKNPTIKFNDLATQSDRDEQDGLKHLFAGTTLAIRNPRGHDNVTDSAEYALEYIVLISSLAKRLESASVTKPTSDLGNPLTKNKPSEVTNNVMP